MNQRIVILLSSLLLAATQVWAQYPFDRFCTPAKKAFSNWIESISDPGVVGERRMSKIDLCDVFPHGDTCALVLSDSSDDNIVGTTDIKVLRNSVLMQEFNSEQILFNAQIFSDCPVFVADYNGDGEPDIKFSGWYGGTGLAGLNRRIIYLLQDQNHHFTKVSFLDMNVIEERDLDSNDHFAIVTMNLSQFNNHSYWTFNLYRIADDDLVSVSDRYGYPKFIQYLFRENYKVVPGIADSIRHQFCLPKPPDYLKDNGTIFDQ